MIALFPTRMVPFDVTVVVRLNCLVAFHNVIVPLVELYRFLSNMQHVHSI